MRPFSVVKDLDLFKQAVANLFLVPITLVRDPLDFQSLKKRLGHGIGDATSKGGTSEKFAIDKILGSTDSKAGPGLGW